MLDSVATGDKPGTSGASVRELLEHQEIQNKEGDDVCINHGDEETVVKINDFVVVPVESTRGNRRNFVGQVIETDGESTTVEFL